MERDGRDIIHLGVGDPDFDTPAGIVSAAVTALENGRTHYSPIPGEVGLRAAIAEQSAQQTGAPVGEGQVTIFPGAQCALFATLQCLAGPDDEVILLEPFYATYEGVARSGGAQLVTVPLPADKHFDLDIERIGNAITGKTRVILTNSPGNPSGAVFSKDSWESLLSLCIEKDIWLVSDEVYSDLVYDCVNISPLGLPGAQNNVVVVSSVSKSHAMTGWRLGWCVAPESVSAHLANLAQCLLFGVTQFVQDAAEFALRESQADVAAIKEASQRRRDVLCDRLGAIDGLTVHKPGGGMFAMVDVSGLGIDGEEFASGLLDHSGVAVVPGFAFGDSAKDYVRIGFLITEAELHKATDRIEEFVSSIGV